MREILYVPLGPLTQQPSWIDNHFTGRTSKQHLQTVQHVSAEDAFIANKVCLQSARMFLSIQIDPDTKVKGWRGTARDAPHPTRPPPGSGEL
jgi:hypothetical protein